MTFNQLLNLALSARHERSATGSYGSAFQELMVRVCARSHRAGIGGPSYQALIYLAFNDPHGFVRCREIENARRVS